MDAPNSGPYTPVPFDRFRTEVEKLYQEPQKRRKTLRKVRQVLRELSAHCATTADLDPLAIASWMAAHPDRKASTWYSLLATLRGVRLDGVEAVRALTRSGSAGCRGACRPTSWRRRSSHSPVIVRPGRSAACCIRPTWRR